MTSDLALANVVAEVQKQLTALTGYPAAGASAASRRDGGWRLDVDVIEVERVPATTSVLATYEVDADGTGNVEAYRRIRRFYRNAAEES